MTNIFKNVRVLLCALVLCASTHGAMAAQKKVTPSPTPKISPKPKPKPAPEPSSTPSPSPALTPDSKPTPTVDGINFRLNFVTPEGLFKNEFKSFDEAYKAGQGDSKNQLIRTMGKIIVMNARCGDGFFGDKVSFSLYKLERRKSSGIGKDDLGPVVKSYLDYRATISKHPDMVETPEEKQRYQAFIDEVMKTLAISRFPRKAECDAVPVALSLPQLSDLVNLEVDDTQSPLVGPKINDGFLYDALIQNSSRFTIKPGQERAFWEKYGTNRFPTAQDAADAAAFLSGEKVLIYNGTNFSLYRIGDFSYDYTDSKGDAQYDVFKTTPIRKGWKIVGIVTKKKYIPIYNPNAK